MSKNFMKLLKGFVGLIITLSFVAFFVAQTSKSSEVIEVKRRSPQYATVFLSEAGTFDNPYVIGSKADMDQLSLLVSQGNTFAGKYFTVDATLSEIYLGDFISIGSNTKPFDGYFDGYGVNFILDQTKEALDYQGLFGYLRTGILENFSVSGTVKGRNYVGGVLGYLASGQVRNVYNTARIDSTGSHAGGIIGLLERGTLTSAYNRGEVTAVANAGGVVGYSYLGIRTDYSTYRNNSITHVYSSGLVSANSNAGGVIGYDNPTVYSGGNNPRNNIYYDVTVIANYKQPKTLKPSTTQSGQGVNSGVMFTGMSTRLNQTFTFRDSTGNFSFYPELKYFNESPNSNVQANSNEFVTVDTTNGIGTEDKPFLIKTVTDIENLKNQINTGETYLGFFFKVADGRSSFSLGNFVPIGSSTKPFFGSFDGNHAEFILNINSSLSYQGLFGYFGHGEIKNLSVSGSVTGLDYVSGVVGYKLSGTISNVYNEAILSGRNFVGGIVGRNEAGVVDQTYNNGDITSTGSYVGGLVGFLYQGTLSNGYNRAEIIGIDSVGGVLGFTYRYIRIAYSTYVYNNISNLYNAGLVSSNTNVGGVIGQDSLQNYSGSGNVRSNLYYDTSVLVTYDQPKNLKPEVTGHAYGKTSSELLYGTPDTLGLSSSIWSYIEKVEDVAYYPQLKSFEAHSVTRISNDSYQSTAYDVGDGLGTKEFPFLIRDAFDMEELSRKVALGNTYFSFHFKVDDGISEIDLGNFSPIGSNTKPFDGNFDGNGVNFILAIDNPGLNYQGLFGYTRTGIIENLSVSGSVKGLNRVGGIVGEQNSGTLRNVYNTATIEAAGSYAGGITGLLERATLSGAYNRGEVIATSYAGGVVGYSYLGIRTDYSTYRNNNINNVYSSGTVTANSYAGGVIGYDNPTVYSGGYNPRTNLYYDITVIANYDQKKTTKPSTDPSTQGINSGVFFKEMSEKLSSSFTFRAESGGFAYYPELQVFSDNKEASIVNRSKLNAQVDVGDGLGTESFPFLIRTNEDIEDLKSMIDKGNTFKGFFFKVDDGISQFDLGNFVPIGSSTKPFFGSFDGNHAEFILNINSSLSYQGLFGYFGHGEIKNLSVSGSVTGLDYVSGVVGYKLSGTISNVYNEAILTGRNFVGGIVGRHEAGVVDQTYNNGDITSTGSYVGGLVGFLYQGTLSNGYNRAEIIGIDSVGGVLGFTYRYIRIAYSTYVYNNVSNLYSSGLVSSNTNVGGVIGQDSLQNYTASGNVRSNLYYDTSVLVTYDQPKTTKPPVTGHAYGKTTSDLVYASSDTLGFNANLWHFEPKDGTTGYYPQLITFSNHSETRISNDSYQSTAYDVGDGLGTKEFPFLIRDAFDMEELSRKVALGNTYFSFHFKVDDGISEIDLGNFSPIGSNTKPFDGNFDGNGVNFILAIDNPGLNYQGLFGYTRTGIIENLSVSGSVKGLNRVGGIVGEQNSGTLRNVYNTATIEAAGSYAGGITGLLERATLSGAYNRGEVIATSYAGGVVGYSYLGIRTDYSTYRNNNINNVYSSGTVTANSYAGGVIGYDNPTVYSGGYNPRTNLYYDITVIANYDQKKTTKPSTDPSTQGINSGVFFKEMSTKLSDVFYFEAMTDNEAYYPQLNVFRNSETEDILSNSIESVRVDVSLGLGTEDIPFLIKDKLDIDELKRMVDKGNTFKGFFFKVDEGISQFDLGNFVPIGSSTKPFFGSFDGNHAEFILDINSTVSYQGLFGYFGHGTIKNLSVSGSVSGLDYVSGVVGYKLSGTISNVYNEAILTGRNFVGGIVGRNEAGVVDQTYNNGDITSTGSYVGGLVGFLYQGTLSNGYNRAEIVGNDSVGGILGFTYRYIRIAYSTYVYNNVSNLYNAGLVSSNTNVGGVIGQDSLQNYSGSGNVRSNLYYDTSLYQGYQKPKNNIPSLTPSASALLKTQMIAEGLIDKLGQTYFTYYPIEGNYAYYPQLKTFESSAITSVKEASMLSVRTNPFLGDGTKDSPYLINNEGDLINLSNSITADFSALDTYYLVGSNLSSFDLANTGFKPIGALDRPFRGHFDGAFANINLNINQTDNYVGLFGYASSEATIRNVSVSGVVKGRNATGGLAGYMAGALYEVYSTVSVSGINHTGGLVGHLLGSLEYAYHTGEVISTGAYVGGVVGYNNGVISQTYASSKTSGANYVGGVLGFNAGTISASYYNRTLIEFYTPSVGIKPSFSVGNEQNSGDVTGVEREILFGFDGLDLEADHFSTQVSSGMYDYTLQLTTFKTNVNATIRNNSAVSVRLIRFASGSGDAANPYLIRHEEDMMVLSEVSKEDSLTGLYFKVMDGVETLDLTKEGINFYAIGSNTRRFKGHFDGNHATFILSLAYTTSDYQGLFGFVESGSIKNLRVVGNLSGRDYVGGVVGYALISNLTQVSSHVMVTGRNYVGGVVGQLSNSNLKESYQFSNVLSTGSRVGGLVGHADKSTIDDVYNYGNVHGVSYVGGLFGSLELNSKLSYAYNRGNISSTSSYIGGLIGYLNQSHINQTYSAGLVRGLNNVGGLVGFQAGTSSTFDSYYDTSIIEADGRTTLSSPIRAISNVLDQENVVGVGKSYLTGLNQLTLDKTVFLLQENDGIHAYYPRLQVFESSDLIKEESLISVESYLFAGLGTNESPYILVNAYDMKLLSDLVNGGEAFNDTYFKVRNNATLFDLTLTGLDYQSIGTSQNKFNGYFDGRGIEFRLDLSQGDDTGLFGYVGVDANLENFSVTGKVVGNNNTGAVAGYLEGILSNVYSTADVRGNEAVGGLVGFNEGVIKNAYVINQTVGVSFVGGLVGYQLGQLSDTYAVSEVYGIDAVGGVIGYNSGLVSGSYYNEEIATLKSKEGYINATSAISNEENQSTVLGLTSAQMHEGTLVNFSFSDSSKWVALAPNGFEIYYPQLNVFAKSSNQVIKDASIDSVKHMRFKTGTGSEIDPYIIYNEDDMKALSELIVSRNTMKGLFFKVSPSVDFIDLSVFGSNYVPIGNQTYPFEGSFDGSFAKFMIDINRSAYYQGLFGYIGRNGVVRNLSVDGLVRSGSRFSGGIAGRNAGLIENVYNQAEVISYDYYAGGISGYNDGVILNSYNEGNIQVERYDYAGGITGALSKDARIEDVYQTGLIKGRSYIGGLVGFASGSVKRGYNIGEVTGVSYLGALIGNVDQNAITEAIYYDQSVLNAQTGVKPSRAISTQEDNGSVKGLSSSELSGGYLEHATLGSSFKTTTNEGYVIYHPQLRVFSDNSNISIKEESLNSVTRGLFQGEGTIESPYLIMSNQDLVSLSLLVSEGYDTLSTHFSVYEENQVFDLTSNGFKPIGGLIPFDGHIDFVGATITLRLEEEKDNVGLFGSISQSAKVSNVLTSGYVSGLNYVGGVVGYNEGILFNTSNEAQIYAQSYAGGLVGYHLGDLSESYNHGNVNASQSYAGGITGHQGPNTTISHVYNKGSVSSSQNSAGITPYLGLNSSLVQSFNYGLVTASTKNAAGLVLHNLGEIYQSYHTGHITTNSHAAGLVLINEGTIDETFVSGLIETRTNGAGLVLENLGVINNSYYDLDRVNTQKGSNTYLTISSAIGNELETQSVKGLKLPQMTGLTAIGTNDEQMNLTLSEYERLSGNDFTSYYPQLSYFSKHSNPTIKADSLESVKDQTLLGEGTKLSPYLVKDAFDLMIIHTFLENENHFLGKYFAVAPGVTVIDTTVEGVYYQPLGNDENAFRGQFDFNGINVILNQSRSNDDYLGLFHTIGKDGLVKNLNTSGEILGRSYLGGIAGRNFGKIENVSNYVKIDSLGTTTDGANAIGGVVGVNYGTITNARNFGSISAQGSYIGGIVGENEGVITNSSNHKEIKGDAQVGGITGLNRFEVSKSYNKALVTGVTVTGGITGENRGSISESYNDGTISASGDISGGIAGLQNESSGRITSVYHSGKVSSKETISGGIVGKLDAGYLTDAYVSGLVFSKTELGFVVGQTLGGEIKNAYYDQLLLASTDDTLSTPTKAIGNYELVDNSNLRGLFHGQMVSQSSIGTHPHQLNFSNGSLFSTKPSVQKEAYYPELTYFKNSQLEFVKADSHQSVTTTTFVVGQGTKDDPYIIKDESDVILLFETTNSGNDYEGIYFKVSEDTDGFDFTRSDLGYYFNAIGTKTNPFNGHFDGNGSNFHLNLVKTEDYQGLFGYLGTYGFVTSLSVSGKITGKDYTGGIVGYNEGAIEQVYNQAEVTGSNNTGGIAGYNAGSILYTYNKGRIVGKNNTGGVVGFLANTLSDSYNIGVVYGTSAVGAITGYLDEMHAYNSYYDTRVLGAYRDFDGLIKPTRAVSNSSNSNSVYGLDKAYMTGLSSIGTGNLKMNLNQTVFQTNFNTSGENYPQLVVFSKHQSDTVRALSFESTSTTLYKVHYDYKDADDNNDVLFSYVLENEHYQLQIPFKFGFELEGWYVLEENSEPTKITVRDAKSIEPFDHNKDIYVSANYQIAMHLVRFIDGNNQVIHEETIAHGDYISQTDLIPLKNQSLTKIYEFESWLFDFEQMITKPVDIKANFTEIDRYYQLIFLDGDGNFFTTQKVEYGTQADVPLQIPSKRFDSFAYEFMGWDFNFNESIKQAYTIMPIFKEVPRYYTINFRNDDGSLIQSSQVEYLKDAIKPEIDPTKVSSVDKHYTFNGYDKDVTSIKENLEVYATYLEEDRYYEVTFLDGNFKRFETQQVKYFEQAVEPSGLPRKDPFGPYAYKFIDWDKTFDRIEGDLVVQALFEEIDRYYTVSYVDGNGLPFGETYEVEYLSEAPRPDGIPEKEQTVSHTYVFSHWDEAYLMIKEDTTIEPIFIENLRPYTVTFMDGNNQVYETKEVLYGKEATMPVGVPRKQAVGEVAYRFVSWNESLKDVREDRIITSSFVEVDRYYTVTFYGYDLNLILKQQRVEYLDSATAPTPPVRTDSREAYEYVFMGWDKDFSSITSDLVVKATYINRIRTYEVTVINGDETTTHVVNHGSNFNLPSPIKTGNEQYSYEFLHWVVGSEVVTSLTNIKENVVIEAIFEASYHYYVVTFLDGDLNILEVQHVLKGNDAIAPSLTPKKEKTDEFIYLFKGYDRGFSDISSDLTIKALFDEVDRYYVVNFYDAFDQLFYTEIVEYGNKASTVLVPEKPKDEQYHYVFIGFIEDSSFVNKNLDLYPMYQEELNEFIVNFYNGDNEIVLTQRVLYGMASTPPKEVSKTPSETIYYLFNRFDKENLSSVTSDLDIYPIFDEVARYYKVSFVHERLGIETLLFEQIVEYQKDAYNPIDLIPFDVIDEETIFAATGLEGSLLNVKEDRTIYVLFDEIPRYYTVSYFDYDMSLIKEERVSYLSDGILPQGPFSKPSTELYRYVFDGFDQDVTKVKKDIITYAVYQELNNQFEVTFLDGDGKVFDEQTVLFGQDAIRPNGIPLKTPTKEFSYTFIGFEDYLTNVQENRIIKALFKQEVRRYTVIFVDEFDKVLKEEFVQFGHKATAPEVIILPEDTAEYRYSYQFDRSFDSIYEDTKVTVLIIEEKNEYTYTFFDSEGNIYKEIHAPYGTTINIPNGPTKETDEQFIYTFIGFDQNVPLIITENLEFHPVYESETRTFKVTYLDGNHNVFYEDYVSYGLDGILPTGIPEKAENDQYYYVFRMWGSRPVSVKNDLTIEAVFSRFLQSYTVTFVDEFGNTIKKQDVLYGTGATEPTFDLIPTKPPTTEYEYIFAGWDKSFNYITKDIEVQVRYVPVLRLYTYTFYDEDHTTILKQEKGRYGSVIIPPSVPFKEGTGSTEFRFVGWDKTVPNQLTYSIEFYAVFEEVPVTFKVYFYDGNGFVLDLQIVEYSKAANTPVRVPTKVMTERYEYFFEGYDKDYNEVYSDLHIYPIFKEEIRRFTVTFIYDTYEIDLIKKHNEAVDFDLDPIPTPLRDGFGFVKWDQALTSITKDVEVRPIFRPNKYQIVYYAFDVDGGGLESEVITYGSEVSLSEANYVKRGYQFSGWKTSPDSEVILYPNGANFVYETAGNLELYAAFDPIVYEVTYDTDGGNEIPSDPYTIESPLKVLPVPTKEDHKFIGWELVEIKEDLNEKEVLGRQVKRAQTGQTIITEIEDGTIGFITLKARYVYDGYLVLKEEFHDTLSLVYAEITTIIPIEKREESTLPVYLIGLVINETLADLKNKFINDSIEFLDHESNPVTDLSLVIYTGLQIVLRDSEGQIKDRVRVVLKGDINGDGIINVVDYNVLFSDIAGRTPLYEEFLIAGLINDDDVINVLDANILFAYISGRNDIFE